MCYKLNNVLEKKAKIILQVAQAIGTGKPAQEEIAQMIGSSREMVTRLLTVLKTRNIIQITCDSVSRDRGALENML